MPLKFARYNEVSLYRGAPPPSGGGGSFISSSFGGRGRGERRWYQFSIKKSGKALVQEVLSHAAEDQNLIRLPVGK